MKSDFTKALESQSISEVQLLLRSFSLCLSHEVTPRELRSCERLTPSATQVFFQAYLNKETPKVHLNLVGFTLFDDHLNPLAFFRTQLWVLKMIDVRSPPATRNPHAWVVAYFAISQLPSGARHKEKQGFIRSTAGPFIGDCQELVISCLKVLGLVSKTPITLMMIFYNCLILGIGHIY
jgi:hypothetical protein